MSHLTYTVYEGYGERATKDYGYSQAVRIGDMIHLSGQGGWDRETDAIHATLEDQVEQAFDNIKVALENAGSRGLEDVYYIRSYHVNLDSETTKIMVASLQKHFPMHQPLWTCIGVASLAFDNMNVEIEVKAHIGQKK